MIKLIGATVIMLACSLIGMQCSKRYAKRLSEIREIKNILPKLSNGIEFLQLPLFKLLRNLANDLNTNLKIVFEETADNLQILGAEESFKRAISKNKTNLCENEKDALISFFSIIGRSSANEQIKNIDNVNEVFKNFEQEAYELNLKYGKMCRTLGVCAGLIINIILI